MPNLGIYSIELPDENSQIRVGAFWRRQHFSKRPSESSEGSGYNGPGAKRLAAEPHILGRSIDHLNISIASQSTSNNSGKTTHASGSPTSGNFENVLYNTDSREISSTNSSKPTGFSPLIDTQISSIPSRSEDDDTHESIVLNLNPECFDQSESETSPPIRHFGEPDTADCSSVYTKALPRRMRKKVYPKQLPYEKIMSGVIFVMSGFENPRRGKLRDLALKMGAKYEANWTKHSTHLICAFKNTPKFKEVMAKNGRITREHWIQECSKRRQLLDWRNFKLGDYPYPDSEEEVDVDDLDYALETSYVLNQQGVRSI